MGGHSLLAKVQVVFNWFYRLSLIEMSRSLEFHLAFIKTSTSTMYFNRTIPVPR